MNSSPVSRRKVESIHTFPAYVCRSCGEGNAQQHQALLLSRKMEARLQLEAGMELKYSPRHQENQTFTHGTRPGRAMKSSPSASPQAMRISPPCRTLLMSLFGTRGLVKRFTA
jgi:hypothetical protein